MVEGEGEGASLTEVELWSRLCRWQREGWGLHAAVAVCIGGGGWYGMNTCCGIASTMLMMPSDDDNDDDCTGVSDSGGVVLCARWHDLACLVCILPGQAASRMMLGSVPPSQTPYAPYPVHTHCTVRPTGRKPHQGQVLTSVSVMLLLDCGVGFLFMVSCPSPGAFPVVSRTRASL